MHKSDTSGTGLSSGYKRQYHRPPAMHSAAQALEMERRSIPEDAKMGCRGDNAGPNVWFEDGDMDQYTPAQFLFAKTC